MGPDVAKKRGDESKNYSPPIPPTRLPFLLILDHFYVRFLAFSAFHFLPIFFSFLDPIGPHWTPLDRHHHHQVWQLPSTPSNSVSGSDAQNWALVSEPGFLYFQLVDSRDFVFTKYVWEIWWWDIEENNKGVLDRPWTKRRVLRAMSSTLEFPVYRKSWKIKIWLFGETENWRPGAHKVAHHFSAHFCLVKTPSIAICAERGMMHKKNPYEIPNLLSNTSLLHTIYFGRRTIFWFGIPRYDVLW